MKDGRISGKSMILVDLGHVLDPNYNTVLIFINFEKSLSARLCNFFLEAQQEFELYILNLRCL